MRVCAYMCAFIYKYICDHWNDLYYMAEVLNEKNKIKFIIQSSYENTHFFFPCDPPGTGCLPPPTRPPPSRSWPLWWYWTLLSSGQPCQVFY